MIREGDVTCSSALIRQAVLTSFGTLLQTGTQIDRFDKDKFNTQPLLNFAIHKSNGF